MALRGEKLRFLLDLEPDIAVIQECGSTEPGAHHADCRALV